MKFGQYGKADEPEGSYAVTMFGPYVAAQSETAGYPKPGTLNHPTDVAVDPDGDIYVTDCGNPPGLRLRFRGKADLQSDR